MRYYELREARELSRELREARDQGLFVKVTFDEATKDRIAAYQERHNVPKPTPRDKLHTTILYSRKVVPWEAKKQLDVHVSPDGSEITTFPGKEKAVCLVWKYKCAYLKDRFDHGRELGATFDYDSYKPHVTLSYDVGHSFDWRALPTPDFAIVLKDEIAMPIDEEWEKKPNAK